MSYIFVLLCIFSDRACSFICRSLAHRCTFLALLSMPSPNPWHDIKWDNDVWCLDGDGSKSSHLFCIIKATCNRGACFGWYAQDCNQAIGTRAVNSKWVSKFTSDLERSFSIYFYQIQGHSKYYILSISLDQAAALGSGMHKSTIFLGNSAL